MKNQIILSLALLTSLCSLQAQDIDNYLTQEVVQGKYIYEIERDIVDNYKAKKLIKALDVYLNDSIENIRERSYYLLSQKARQESTSLKDQQKITHLLLQGIDNQKYVNNQFATYLSNMPPTAYTAENIVLLEQVLADNIVVNKKDLVLLAGYCGAASTWLKQTFKAPESTLQDKWYIALALSRQGSKEHTTYCLEQVKTLELGSRLVDFIVPNLIYTRNKQLFDYCVEMLYDEENRCVSANADISDMISCGYPMMHKLAPVVKDFPYKLDASRTIDADDYEQALIDIRNWFTINPDYEIINTSY